MANITMTLDELSDATGKAESWWRRHWLRMHQQYGFPRRLPGLWAWPRGQVAAWLAGGHALPIDTDGPANSNDPPDLQQARLLLEQRFGLSG